MIGTDYIIRNYIDEDAETIAAFNFIAMLSYRYNKDFIPQNIFCAVNNEGMIYGIGHLEPDDSWFSIEDDSQASDFLHKLKLEISINTTLTIPEFLYEELFEVLVERAKQIRTLYPKKRIQLIKTLESDELEEMDFYLSNGFTCNRNHLIMKRDLTKPIPDIVAPKNIKIVDWKMNNKEEANKYLDASAQAFDSSWSLNRLNWMRGGSEFNTFIAFDGDCIIGSVTTWGINDKRSATENIFVIPAYRNQGIAKAVITEALKHLKGIGKTEATLGVYGENSRAIPLYQSLGYKMLFVIIEFGLEL